MHRLIPSPSTADSEIVSAGDPAAHDCYFRLVQVPPHSQIRAQIPGFELICVVLSGNIDVRVGEQQFPAIGQRADVWSGGADSVYIGTQNAAEIKTSDRPAEIALIGGRCAGSYAPFHIPPSAIETITVGSVETHSCRHISHILGQNALGRAGNLLVSELHAEPGCSSGYPPHKHDEERPPLETQFQEIYHYRFDPPTGFGTQIHYRDGEIPSCYMTRNGDTFAFDDGYHPTSTSPGHRGYLLTILVGKHQRSLIQFFDPKYEYLMSKIPGISDMRAKFK
jgi:5-deoxy-glucuronate isomerase